MTDLEPTTTTNLDRYGSLPLPWSRAHKVLDGASRPGPGDSYFLDTTRPDGRPHVAAVGALWHDGDLYVVSGAETCKSRNLAAIPACAIAVGLEGIDLTLEGEATRVTDRPTLERVAALYREKAAGRLRRRATRSRRRTAPRVLARRPGNCTASRSTRSLGLPPPSRMARRAGGSSADGGNHAPTVHAPPGFRRKPVTPCTRGVEDTTRTLPDTYRAHHWKRARVKSWIVVSAWPAALPPWATPSGDGAAVSQAGSSVL